MGNILKFSILFIVCSVLLSVLSAYVNSLFLLFGASIDYVTTGSVGSVFYALAGYFGWFLDLLFLNQNVNYVTHFGGMRILSIAWALTIFRVLFGLSVLILILKLIFDR